MLSGPTNEIQRQGRLRELKRGFNNSPHEGFELEFLVDLLRQLIEAESYLEKCRERLILRCDDFNNNLVIKLFEPSAQDGVNLYVHNIKRAFKHVGIDLDPTIASSILKRFDSNFDGELTYSDV